MNPTAIGILLISISLVACASSGVDPRNKNIAIKISYGTVKTAEAVDLQSEAGKSAAIGGLWGLLANADGNRGDMAGGAALGALFTGLTTKIAEGSRKASAYEVGLQDGSTIKVVIDDKDLVAGDCVAIETGKTTNIRKVAAELCDNASFSQVEAEVSAEMIKDAEHCHAAKQRLLEAESEQALDLAMKKVNILCH